MPVYPVVFDIKAVTKNKIINKKDHKNVFLWSASSVS